MNFTAGLPVVRTSPAHGVGFDIAGQDKADEQAMRNAIYMAIDVLRSRKVYEEISADPLQKFKREGGADGGRPAPDRGGRLGHWAGCSGKYRASDSIREGRKYGTLAPAFGLQHAKNQ